MQNNNFSRTPANNLHVRCSISGCHEKIFVENIHLFIYEKTVFEPRSRDVWSHRLHVAKHQ